MGKKRRRGKPKLITGALNRQPDECEESVSVELCNEETMFEPPAKKSKKVRGLPAIRASSRISKI